MHIRSKGCVRSPYGTKSLVLYTECAERINSFTLQRSQTFVQIEKLGTSKPRNGRPCGRYLRLHIARLCAACVIGSSSYTGGLVQAQPLKEGFWCSNIQVRRYEVDEVMSTPLPPLARSKPIASQFTAGYQLRWDEKLFAIKALPCFSRIDFGQLAEPLPMMYSRYPGCPVERGNTRYKHLLGSG
jgi:hypothetical protein